MWYTPNARSTHASEKLENLIRTLLKRYTFPASGPRYGLPLVDNMTEFCTLLEGSGCSPDCTRNAESRGQAPVAIMAIVEDQNMRRPAPQIRERTKMRKDMQLCQCTNGFDTGRSMVSKERLKPRLLPYARTGISAQWIDKTLGRFGSKRTMFACCSVHAICLVDSPTPTVPDFPR